MPTYLSEVENNKMQDTAYLIGKHISRCLDGHNMGVIGEYSKQHWTVVFTWGKECAFSMEPLQLIGNS